MFSSNGMYEPPGGFIHAMWKILLRMPHKNFGDLTITIFIPCYALLSRYRCMQPRPQAISRNAITNSSDQNPKAQCQRTNANESVFTTHNSYLFPAHLRSVPVYTSPRADVPPRLRPQTKKARGKQALSAGSVCRFDRSGGPQAPSTSAIVGMEFAAPGRETVMEEALAARARAAPGSCPSR